MFKISPFKFTYKVFNSNSTSEKSIFSKVGFDFKANGLFLVSGPSGSGKTTFLNLLKGLSPFHIPGTFEGEIKFNNEVFSADAVEKYNNQIVYLFQNPFSQIIHHTPELEFAFTLENLNQGSMIYEKKFEELNQKFDLGNIWKNSTNKLSNGECQKLVLASLIATGPKVILLDEPTAFLDPQARKEFYEILNTLKKDHLILIVDHHFSEIKKYVDQFIVVDSDGEVQLKEDYDLEKKPVDKFPLDSIAEAPIINLEINNASFGFEKNRMILKNANLKIKSGEVVILKGKNGQGKSTFFKIIAQLIRPKQGSIDLYLANKKLAKKDFRNQIAFVFQNPENCFFYQSLNEEFKNVPKKILDMFFNENELGRSPYLFSEGQKRRISILIYLFLGKNIFLFDEPTFGQDFEQKERIANIVKELKSKNKIQLIISHDEEFISSVADRVLELRDGNLYEIK